MEFPHIKDDKFPNVNNVDVWKFQNDFDYARWEGKVSIKLLNVLWNSNYADVPGFSSDKERDEWFDAQEGLIKTLESVFNVTPENSIRIPVPYNDAYRFNYLVVDMPMQTSSTAPIDYELENTRVKRWYYFIDSMNQYAPNTTELYITLDVWTTFSHTVNIPYLMLERGHAPMMQTSVEQFLNNPIVNNEYLLAEDFNYGNDTIIQTSNYHPIGNGTKYVLFCAPYAKSDFLDFGGGDYSGNSTPPSYANTDARWGYQITVNDYQWKYGNGDYSNANLPIHNQIENGILGGCACYAIEGNYAKDFFNECAKNCVNFIHGIQAMFILDEALFNKGDSITFKGYTIYEVSEKHSFQNFSFVKEQFGFDEKYCNITKLYTFPYSELEITDDEGNSFTAKVENCGNIQIHKEVSLVYPFLNYNVFFSGINGDTTMHYEWKKIQGTNEHKEMWASDFSKFMMNWEIPTYSIYVSAENEYAANNYFGVQAKRAGAIKDYRNAVRYANTNRENTKDSFTTNTANVNRTTTKDVNNVADIQAGLVSNMEDTNDTNDTITDDLLCGNGSLLPNATGFLTKTAWSNWKKVADDADTDWMYLNNAFNANADYFISSSVINGAASVLGGGASTGGSIASAGENASAAAIGLPIIGGIASGIATSVSIPLTITKDQTLKDLQQSVISDKTAHAGTNVSETLSAQRSYNKSVKDENNDLREKITNRFSKSNGINNTNASRDKTANDTNASATQTTETNNATYTRNATIEAEKANLVQKQLEAENIYKNARLQRPSTYSQYSGDFANDVYQRRGVRFNIRTQTKAAISQAGDAFLRYGYALHRAWDMSNGWHYGKHFTFWKAEDIWINEGEGLSGNAVNIIGDILTKGVTVWRNPNEIGKVSIYDNI